MRAPAQPLATAVLAIWSMVAFHAVFVAAGRQHHTHCAEQGPSVLHYPAPCEAIHAHSSPSSRQALPSACLYKRPARAAASAFAVVHAPAQEGYAYRGICDILCTW